MDTRLPAHVEVGALVRRAHAEGGFAAVLKKGEEQAGTLLVVITDRGVNARVYERMPQADGTRQWHCSRRQDAGDPGEFADYLERRGRQDDDLWIVELDVPDGERLIGLSAES